MSQVHQFNGVSWITVAWLLGLALPALRYGFDAGPRYWAA